MSGGLHSLATIIKRLEAATSRLEDLTISHGSTLPKRDDLVDDLGSNDSYTEPLAPQPPPAPVPVMAETPRSIIAFDEIIMNGKLKAFVELTKSIAVPTATEQVKQVENMFNDLRTVILTASACQKPDDKALAEMMTPLRGDIESVMTVRDKAKEREWRNHLDVVAEGAPSVGWVTAPKPGPYVQGTKEAAEFYAIKIIQEFKDKDEKHVKWARAWISLIEEQRKYIMEYHTTGLMWNAKGEPLSKYAAATPSAAAPPPPPPPPPPAAPAPVSGSGGAAAVFAELNRGEDVTKGLKKVDPSQMTHKNPELRAGATVPTVPASGGTPKRPTKPSKPQSLMGKKPSKPPKFALEGTKWIVEYHENEPSLVIENGELSQSVNIFGCKATTILIKGKVNAVTLVNCTKTSVLVESVVSSISVTNSPSFALQITGLSPTIQLDSTDSGQIYLSKECLGVEITTAKCSSINVSLPVEDEEEGVFVERAVPEMLRTTIQGGKLVTTIVEHSA